MSHEQAWTLLPDLLGDRNQPALLGHVAACHDCQRRLFLLERVDRLLREAAGSESRWMRDRSRWRRLRLPAAAAVVCALLALAPAVWQRPGGRQAMTLRTVSGRAIGTARLTRLDHANTAVLVVADRLPSRGRAVDLLWAQDTASALRFVGRLMVDSRGSCHARFRLPGDRRWVRLWITEAADRNAVIAST